LNTFMKSLLTLLINLATLGLALTALAADAPALAHYNLDKDRLALAGHDPVGYQTEGKALKGSAVFAAQHLGVTYHFATDANRKMFLTAPEKYAPTYGGWCATAMAKGKKVEIDPTNFKVTNGRLFLFYKGFFADARPDWVKDEPAQTARADANWKQIANE
jgi:YHS domain-containing protein